MSSQRERGLEGMLGLGLDPPMVPKTELSSSPLPLAIPSPPLTLLSG